MLTPLALLLLAASGGSDTTSSPPQGVEYRIEAVLEEGSGILRGRGRLRYTNRAGVPLDTLWFHQHLNAFRPNSAWARSEALSGSRRFQALGPAEHAFERLTRVEVNGRGARPVYPGAPDSTVLALPLPAPIAPGQTVDVLLDWEARLSTLPRRQGRRGREFNWAHWYPRIAVFEGGRWRTQALLPQGEFYGEFGSYDVTLDLAADQVIGATGVPVEGDPGWARVAERPGEIRYRRDAYPSSDAAPLGLLPAAAGAGRKRVRWRADRVHHFVWSASPGYRYEGGAWRDVPIHVLYGPDQAGTWGNGAVVERTVSALDWLDSIFGSYAYPQLTILPRIEAPGGTEFPMLIMNGSASQGLIVHEATHQFAHGMLANNEWAEGWLDEGLTEFVTYWYWEAHGETNPWKVDVDTIQARERVRATQPIALPGAEFESYRMYSRMTYTKAALVFRMLRDLVGPDTMRDILREYYRRHAFQHVSEASLRRVAEEVSGRELDWFFDQWIHTTHALDYGIADAVVERMRDGRWRTRLKIVRVGAAWMPVTLQLGDQRRLLTSRDLVQTVEIVTARRPTEAVLDPAEVLIDLDRANNRRRL